MLRASVSNEVVSRSKAERELGYEVRSLRESLGDAIDSFKQGFQSSDGASGNPTDPTSVDADEMGDAESNKTLATE